MPEFLAAQICTADRLLENGAFELRYTDLYWAIHRLGRLAREGR
jgi:hypothetical protein